MKAAKSPLATILMACSLALSSAASDAGAPAKQPAWEEMNQSSAEYQTTGDEARKYEEAYNKGDAKTLASFYSEDVDYIDQDGAEVKGRNVMERLLADNFEANRGVKLAITVAEGQAAHARRDGKSRARYRDAGKRPWRDDTVHGYQGQERRSLGDFPIDRNGGTATKRLFPTPGL
jgi:ketosteroid isomerase-like protein